MSTPFQMPKTAARDNLEFLEQQYNLRKTNPDQVDPALIAFFDGVDFANHFQGDGISSLELSVYRLVSAYRDYGHLNATLDPLKQQNNLAAPQLDPKNYDLSDKDMDTEFQAGELIGLGKAKLKDIITKLKNTYSSTYTCDVAGCEPNVQKWFQKQFENGSHRLAFSPEEKRRILYSLIRTESLEKFIHSRFVGTKRFSIEGGDALMPMLEGLVQKSTHNGVEEIAIGMAHRGRVNVLSNFMGKALELIFADFEGKVIDNSGYSGDVKYHMGYSSDKETEGGGSCHVSLAFNPSHLEMVNPVVCGIVRAKQRYRKDTAERKKVVPIQIHGDAAFAGQGIVTETLQLSQLDGYKVGGSIHIIINNQVGFTTFPRDSRSTRYSADVAKGIKAPIILVNGDDVEACVSAANLALRFRQEMKQDVVIDLICYRRFGHNEGDEPAFTQPVMYDAIKTHPTLKTIYAKSLNDSGTQVQTETDRIYQEKIDNLQKILEQTRQSPPEFKPLAFDGLWKGLRRGKLEDFDKPVDTTFDKKNLLKIAEVVTAEPKNFNVHPKIAKLLEARRQMVKDNALDWGLTELLCYGSLVSEGTSVRLSGQDAKRGTFTHRQCVYFDTKTNQEICPLSTINPPTEFCVYNSPLSELAVLGFEYGNSIADPMFMTIWEAQFGDFANGAQVIIDQFLCSGEEKWARMVGLTLLLPHGYEGQGPEHSSARLERFLQLSAHDNMQICNLTTPANLFHALRRQMKRDFRKPLVIMSPKSLLRHPKVVSTVDDLASGTFQEVISDPRVKDNKNIQTLLLCTGKVYYDLAKTLETEKREHIAVVRLEQICPFPRVQLTKEIQSMTKLKRIVWVQEEPMNMGAYWFVYMRLKTLLEDLGLNKMEMSYAGRIERSSPAVGSPKVHEREQNELIAKALSY